MIVITCGQQACRIRYPLKCEGQGPCHTNKFLLVVNNINACLQRVYAGSLETRQASSPLGVARGDAAALKPWVTPICMHFTALYCTECTRGSHMICLHSCSFTTSMFMSNVQIAV